MKENDGRKLSREAQAQIRINAVKRVLSGESPEVVIRSIGYERIAIYRWLALYRVGGFDALRVHKSSGRPPLMNAKQLKKLYDIIVNKTPEQLKFPFALWTVDIVRQVIDKKFNIKLSAVSTWRTLRALGLTPQRPKRIAYQQNPDAVKNFLKKEYPAIKKAAKAVNADIYWGDEASIRSDYHSGTTWGKKGETPVVKTTGARFSINMISAICGNGQMRFMVTNKKCTNPVFIEFLKKLIFKQKNPIFLVVDGHPVHKSKAVKEFVESTNGRLKLFYLPAYSPDLNPDETVWAHIKYHTIGKKTITGPDQFLSLVNGALNYLRRKTNIVSAFFQKPSLQYI